MTTYRSHEEFGQRFAGAPIHVNGVARFPVEEYLLARGEDFAGRYSAAEFLTLSQAIDLHRVDPARIEVSTLLIGFASDQLVPVTQLRELAAQLGALGRLVELPSPFGHDGFLKEFAALTPLLADAVAGEVV
jgi:homoserine O-acetyltransferase